MVDRGRCPSGGTVALLAVLREIQCNMIGRTLVVGFMARIAIGRQSGIGSARVALRARQTGMLAGQREKRMVEIHRTPTVHGVARRAILREVLFHMTRRILEIRTMTGIAVLRQTGKSARRCMALRTIETAMPPGEREEIVTNICPIPTDGSMAELAI